MAHFIRGTCEQMCPTKEIEMRTRERLLHFYELKNGQKMVPGIIVKSFSRSAAGVKMPRRDCLRTEKSLENTIEYLLSKILLDVRKPFSYAYDFIFDRLRAVRQEIVIQNFNTITTIQFLQPIALFLAYSRYRLSDEPVDTFDSNICDQHIQECLKRILSCYDELLLAKDPITKSDDFCIRRILFESMYQVFNMGSGEALKRCYGLCSYIRTHPVFKRSFNISLEYYRGNLYQTVVQISKLPHILCALAAVKIPYIRKKMFQILSIAYNCRIHVPVNWLQKILLYTETDEYSVISDFEYYFNQKLNFNCDSIQFQKSSFDLSKSVRKDCKYMFVDEKLFVVNIPELLLLKNTYI